MTKKRSSLKMTLQLNKVKNACISFDFTTTALQNKIVIDLSQYYTRRSHSGVSPYSQHAIKISIIL